MPASALPEPVVGRPARWARDFAVIGAASGALAPAYLIGLPTAPSDSPYAFAALVVGAALGALLGAAAPAALEASRRRVRLRWLLLLGPVIGVLWGGLTAGGAAAWVLRDEFGRDGYAGYVVLVALFGGLAGAVQLG